MSEETTETPVANTTDTQQIETETEQKNVAKTEEGEKGEQSAPTLTEDKPAVDTPLTTPAKPVKPDPTPTTEEPKKLADVVPTSLVWISGMVGSCQIDC